MRRKRVLLVLLAVVTGVVFLQRPAAATCQGPTLAYEAGEYDRLDVVLVVGQSFGTDCYDTGPAPEGEGSLGPPVVDIEIAVTQNDREWIVAAGAANKDYTFSVEITLPADLEPGEARITAHWGLGQEPYIETTDPIIVSETAVDSPSEPDVARFDPPLVVEPAPDNTDNTNRGPWIAAGIVVGITAIGGLMVLSRR